MEDLTHSSDGLSPDVKMMVLGDLNGTGRRDLSASRRKSMGRYRCK